MTNLEQWREKNISYYKDIEELYQFFVKPQSDVLEIGSGTGHLLDSVSPDMGVGIDSNSLMVELSEQKFPNLKFLVEEAEV